MEDSVVSWWQRLPILAECATLGSRQIHANQNHPQDIGYKPAEVKSNTIARQSAQSSERYKKRSAVWEELHIIQIIEPKYVWSRIVDVIPVPEEGVSDNRRQYVNEQVGHSPHVMEQECNEWQDHCSSQQRTAGRTCACKVDLFSCFF